MHVEIVLDRIRKDRAKKKRRERMGRAAHAVWVMGVCKCSAAQSIIL